MSCDEFPYFAECICERSLTRIITDNGTICCGSIDFIENDVVFGNEKCNSVFVPNIWQQKLLEEWKRIDTLYPRARLQSDGRLYCNGGNILRVSLGGVNQYYCVGRRPTGVSINSLYNDYGCYIDTILYHSSEQLSSICSRNLCSQAMIIPMERPNMEAKCGLLGNPPNQCGTCPATYSCKNSICVPDVIEREEEEEQTEEKSDYTLFVLGGVFLFLVIFCSIVFIV